MTRRVAVLALFALAALSASTHAEDEPPPDVVIDVHVLSGLTLDELPGRELQLDVRGAGPRPVTTDRRAHLAITVPRGTERLRLSDAETSGWLTIDETATEGTVHLLPHRALAIRVEDADGRPIVGLPVRLRGDRRVARSTAPAGIAIFDDARTLAPPYERAGLAAQVLLDSHGHSPFEVPLDIERLPHGPVTLALPNAGRLDVRVVDGRGATERGAATAYAKAETDWMSAEERVAAAYAAPVLNGHAAFPWMPGDLDLEVIVESDDPTRPTARGRLRTPRESLTVQMGPSRTTLVGRLVDDAGQPLGGVYLNLNVELAGGGIRRGIDARTVGGCKSDEDGRVSITFDLAPGQLAGAVVDVAVTTIREGGQLLRTELPPITLATEFRAARTDLGDVRTTRGEVIAAGRVTDPSGAPVPHTTVRARRWKGEYWGRVPKAIAVTEADGRFVLRGSVDATTVQLVTDDGTHYLPAPIELRRGATDVAVVVRPTGGFSGSLRLDPTLRGAVNLRFVGPPAARGGNVIPGRGPSVPVMEGRRGFRANGLRPGVGRLDVVRGSEVLVTVAGIEIVEGEISNDARLQGLVVAPSDLAMHTLTVHDEDGRPLPNVRIRFAPAGDLNFHERDTDQAGNVRLPRGSQPVRVFAVRRGCRAVVLDDLRENTTAVLSPIAVQKVPVVLRGGGSLGDPRLSLKAKLVWCGPPRTSDDARPISRDPRNFGLSAASPDGAGQLELEAWEPGVYAVRVMLHFEDGGSSVDTIGSPRVQVDETGRAGPTVVELDGEHLRKVIARRLAR